MSLEPSLLTLAMRGAYEAEVKLEMVEGVTSWEAMPSPRHQNAVTRIARSVAKLEDGSDCGCVPVPDVYVNFPDGSFKRPDIGIYCERIEDTDDATTQIPRAVIEVLSPGYEHKDLIVGPPFYIKHGVADVIVFDPKTGEGHHFSMDGTSAFRTPQTFTLKCGCMVTV